MAINNDTLFQTMSKWLTSYMTSNGCTHDEAITALGAKCTELGEMSVRDFHVDMLVAVNTEFGNNYPDTELVNKWIRQNVSATPSFEIALKGVTCKVIPDDELTPEEFGESLYKEGHWFTGFTSPKKAAQPWLAEKEELNLGSTSDDELASKLMKVNDYFLRTEMCTRSTMLFNILDAAQMRIRWLSNRFKALDGKEVSTGDYAFQSAPHKSPAMIEQGSITEEIDLHRKNLAKLKLDASAGVDKDAQLSLNFYIEQIQGSITQCEKCLMPYEKLANPELSLYYSYHKERVTKLKELLEWFNRVTQALHL